MGGNTELDPKKYGDGETSPAEPEKPAEETKSEPAAEEKAPEKTEVP